MRRVSIKRKRLVDQARPLREALIRKHGECMVCGRGPGNPYRDRPIQCSQLCVHEIANGRNRARALDKPYACLVVCWYCNAGQLENKRLWPEARQLALLRLKSPGDYNLQAYNALVSPKSPKRITQEEVDRWTEKLASQSA